MGQDRLSNIAVLNIERDVSAKIKYITLQNKTIITSKYELKNHKLNLQLS
jgi:hypothetical protein